MFKFIHAADIHLDSPLKGLEQYEVRRSMKFVLRRGGRLRIWSNWPSTAKLISS